MIKNNHKKDATILKLICITIIHGAWSCEMNEEEFLELVRKHQDQVYRHTLYLLKNIEDAKDMTQETFMKAWQHRSKLRQDTVRYWLLKCARNLCFNKLKRRKFQVHLSDEDDSDSLEILLQEHSHQSNPSPEENTINLETKQLVHQAIAELPPDIQSIVIMRELEEMSYKEIAKVVKQSENTIKSTVFRARKKLREILNRLMEI